jgi:hypothetical protein
VRARSADDADVISRRVRELDAERMAVFNCACETVVGERGEVVKVLSSSCPVHRDMGGCY